MNAHVKLDRMMEATRLTREGRLSEAMSVIRAALAGRTPEDDAPTSKRTPYAQPATDVIDLVPPSPETGNAWTHPDPANVSSAKAPTRRSSREGVLKGLGSLLNTRAPHRFAPRARTGVPVAPFPEGAHFVERTFTNAAGSRAYKLYIPATYSGQSLPLVVMLHGCTQSPDDFAAGTQMNEIAEAQPCFVAYPEQAQSANPQRCWNWFKRADQQRERGEPSLIAGITREIMRQYAVDPARVYIAGLSAGGAAAVVMGQTYPDLYAAVGVHSGLACGAAQDMPSAFLAMRQGAAIGVTGMRCSHTMPTIVFHGDRDTTVALINGEQVIAQARGSSRAVGSRVKTEGRSSGGIHFVKTVEADTNGRPMLEHWTLLGMGHAWSGGNKSGSYTEPRGVDASREIMRFFLQHSL